VGLNSKPSAWLWFWLIEVLSLVMWAFLGHLLAFSLPDLQTGEIIASGLASLMFVFSGVMINANTMAKGWKILYWLSPLHYTLEGLISTQFHGDTTLVENVLTRELVTAEEFVYTSLGGTFRYDNRFYDLAVLLGCITLLQFFSYLSLKYICHMKR